MLDIGNYSVDIFIKLKNNYTNTVVIPTAKNIFSFMSKEKRNFLKLSDPFIILRKLTKEISERNS